MFVHRGTYTFPRLEVTFLLLYGEIGGLGERLVLIVF